MTLNGKSITSSHLNPGFTHYDKRNLYNTYDVTSQLLKGENVLSAILGNGFYNESAPVATWSYEQARWRNRPRMICEMEKSKPSIQILLGKRVSVLIYKTIFIVVIPMMHVLQLLDGTNRVLMTLNGQMQFRWLPLLPY